MLHSGHEEPAQGGRGAPPGRGQPQELRIPPCAGQLFAKRGIHRLARRAEAQTITFDRAVDVTPPELARNSAVVSSPLAISASSLAGAGLLRSPFAQLAAARETLRSPRRSPPALSSARKEPRTPGPGERPGLAPWAARTARGAEAGRLGSGSWLSWSWTRRRRSSEVEELSRKSYRLRLQDLLPDSHHCPFHLVRRRHVRHRPFRSSFRFRQPAMVHLPFTVRGMSSWPRTSLNHVLRKLPLRCSRAPNPPLFPLPIPHHVRHQLCLQECLPHHHHSCDTRGDPGEHSISWARSGTPHLHLLVPRPTNSIRPSHK